MKRQTTVGVFLLGGLLVGCKGEPKSPLSKRAAEVLHDREMSGAIPILSVADLKRSQAYFRDALGFKIQWEYGSPPHISGVVRGDAEFFLCLDCSGKQARSFIFVKDVDNLYKEFLSKGANVRHPPTDQPWRLREMHVVDLDGNVIQFASEIKK